MPAIPSWLLEPLWDQFAALLPDRPVYDPAHPLGCHRRRSGKNLVIKPGRSRRYQTPAPAARTIAALLALRDHVIAPILAGVRSPRLGRKPATWTPVDRDYKNLRIGMQALFQHLGITAGAHAA